MIFLNPAVLLGLIAASIPILIHLLNLRKLKKVEFSTLAFLKELQKNKIRKIKIKQWLLLALRVAIILFLVFAFARPTLEGVAIGGTTSAAKTSAVFIVDDTFSMSVIDGNGSYLNQAKETLKDLMNQLQEGDDAALIMVSNSGEEIELSNNLAEISKQAAGISPSYSSGYIHNAIVKAADLLGKSDNFNKEIYLLSDFQSTGLADGQPFSDLSELLHDKIKLYAFNYAGKDVFNIGIDELKLNTQIFEKDKPVSFKVTVTNYSKQIWTNGVVSLFINGERSAQQSVTINAGESVVLDMEAVVKDAGQIDVFAEIEDDDILQDNRHFISLNIPEEIPVIIFTENNADARFVQLALTAVDNESTLKISARNLNQLSSVNLSQYEVLVIIGAGNISGIERIESFVNNGGGLLLMPGSNSNYTDFNSLLTGIGLPPASGEAGMVNRLEGASAFQTIDFNHPVFQNIFSNREKKSIESPDVYKHYKLQTRGSGISIITLMDNSSFLSEFKKGKGKIFVLASAPALSWSSFPLKSVFAPLVNKSVFYLASKDSPEEEYYAGTDIDINLSGLILQQIKIKRPDNTEEFLNAESLGGSYISYNNTNLTGNYLVYSGEKAVDNFSVNTEARESNTEYLNAGEFEDYLTKINYKGTFIEVDKGEDPAEVILQARFGSELWKLFLIIAILLAVTEMAIARNAKKELVEAAA
ncbi:MAG: BatA and WFA domain-containing protein [Ignavibacteriaceae bacterium]